jgi:hypothetical protein
MTRSLEALQRRAEKRNVSLNEQKKSDGKSLKSQSDDSAAFPVLINDEQPSRKAVVVPKGKDERRKSVGVCTQNLAPATSPFVGSKRIIDKIETPTNWSCVKCANLNFLKRDTCNRCGEGRPETVTISGGDDPNSACKKSKVVSADVDIDVANPLNRKIKDLEKTLKSLPVTNGAVCADNCWSNKITSEQIAENARLVSILADGNEEEKAKLTPAQLDRAEVLYKRKLRKQLTKAKFKRYKIKTASK